MSGFIDKFSAHAELYARARPAYPAPLIADLATHAPGRALAWDCATGNGQAAGLLAAHFARVHATDASAEQIARASGPGNVSFAVEPAERCSLADHAADLVLVAQALHWFDLPAFFAEARRVLKPGGLLAAIGYDWLFVDDALDAAVGQVLFRPLRPLFSERNAMLWQGYHDVPFPGRALQLRPYAMHMTWTLDALLTYVASWSATRTLLTARPEFLETARAALRPLWGDGDRQIMMPMTVRAFVLD